MKSWTYWFRYWLDSVNRWALYLKWGIIQYMTRYSESTLRYIGDLVNSGRLQDAVEIAKDSGKYSEDEAQSFIIQNERILRNEQTEQRSDN